MSQAKALLKRHQTMRQIHPEGDITIPVAIAKWLDEFVPGWQDMTYCNRDAKIIAKLGELDWDLYRLDGLWCLEHNSTFVICDSIGDALGRVLGV
jgi:hypothetical protein